MNQMHRANGGDLADGGTDWEPDPALGTINFNGVLGAQVGDSNVQNNTFKIAEVVAVSWPVRVGSVPPLAESFQRRAEQDKFAPLDNSGTPVSAYVLSGLGGTGKTQIAAAFARDAIANNVDLVMWINAGSRHSVVVGFASAAAQLGYPAIGEPEHAANWLLGWLSEDRGRKWSVVLDDLADPSELRGLWPRGPRGQTVVTTRRIDAILFDHGRSRIDVGLFSQEQSTHYLCQRLTIDPGGEGEAEHLSGELGRLPLALAQAASFMLDRGEDCHGYRARLKDRRRLLAELFPQDAMADEYQSTVAATWSISMEAADNLSPAGLARPILELASVLDPNGFPAQALFTTSARRYVHTHRRRGQEAAYSAADDIDGNTVDELDCRDALWHLARLSLANLNPQSDATGVRVHALVQRAAVEQLSTDRRNELARAAGDALIEMWPDIDRDPYLGATLRANAVALAAKHRLALWQPDGHAILWKMGTSFGRAGLLNAAIAHFKEIEYESRQYLDHDHPQIFISQAVLANWRGYAGDLDGAVSELEHVLSDQVRVLGSCDYDTLATRQSLGRWIGQKGDLESAISTLEDLLADQQRILGAEDPSTLKTRHDLARWRGQKGDLESAITTLEELLADQQRVLGPDHPSTLTTRHHLGRWRAQKGNLESAITTLEELLADQQRVLGPDHPSTLTTRHYIARWRGQKGEVANAITLLDELLADQQRVLGPDHPNTLTTRHYVVRLEGQKRGAAWTRNAFEQLLADQQRALGPNHPNTLITRYHFAHWMAQAGEHSGAAIQFENLLADQQEVLGSDHPNTLITRRNLASQWCQLGDTDRAVVACEELLADQERAIGPDHPDTLETRYFLGRAYGHNGDVNAAVATLERLLVDQRRVLGSRHPRVWRTWRKMNIWRRRQDALTVGEAVPVDGAAEAGHPAAPTERTEGARRQRRRRPMA